MSSYILASPVERERLQLQARLWEPHVELMLDQIGIAPGSTCLDVAAARWAFSAR